MARGLRPRSQPPAFTLVELLVVVAIIGVLLAVLLPALRGARKQARLATCAANEHSLMQAVHAYAADQRGRIPAGPGDPFPFFPPRPWTDFATGWVWIGAMQQYGAHGLLVDHGLSDLHVIFCPDDGDAEVEAQLANIGTPGDAYGTYGYRHLDETTRCSLDDLGVDSAGLPARALFFDLISDGPTPMMQRMTHDGLWVNLAFTDGHVKRCRNTHGVLSIKAEAFAAFPVSFIRRLDELLVTADYAATGNPCDAPQLP